MDWGMENRIKAIIRPETGRALMLAVGWIQVVVPLPPVTASAPSCVVPTTPENSTLPVPALTVSPWVPAPSASTVEEKETLPLATEVLMVSVF